jgi:hypothetical protein
MPYICTFDFVPKDETINNFLKNVSKETHNNFSYKSDQKLIIWGELHEDWSFEVKSSFQSYAEAIGSISGIAQSLTGIIDKLNSASSLASGTTNVSSDYNKLMVWKETEPLTINAKLVFETKTDPYLDVYVPTMILTSLTSLTNINRVDSKQKNNMYVPGFFAGIQKSSLNREGNVVSETSPPEGGASRANQSQYDTAMLKFIAENGDKGKLLNNCSVAFRSLKDAAGTNISTNKSSVGYDYIPLVSFGSSFINSVKPTFSKDRTTSGVPLRAEVDISVQSLFSANESQFNKLNEDYTNISFTGLGSAITNVFR